MKTAIIIAAAAAIAAAMPAAAAPPPSFGPPATVEAHLITVADRGRGRDRDWNRGDGRGRAEDRGARSNPGRNWSPPPPPSRGRAWSRGDYLPPNYRGAEVRDFGRHRLRPPPAGYDWVQVGPDIYLTQRSTGMVLEAIPGGY